MKRSTWGFACLLAVSAAAGGGCGGTTTHATTYYDPYLHYGYYPADVYYSSYYWTDPYAYYYASAAKYGGGGGSYAGAGGSTGGTGGSSAGTGGSAGTAGGAGAGGSSAGTGGAAGSGGVAPGGGVQTIGDAIRALARGEQVCPNQATITPRTGPAACPTATALTDASGMVKTGATIVFAGCQLSNGGRLDGTIDIDSMRTAADPACGANTMISLKHTSTITNLTYVGPSGRKLMIPNQTGTTMTTYVNGQAPPAPSSTLEGRMQLSDTNGTVTADQTYSGNVTLTPAQDKSAYSIDGMLTLTDQQATNTTTLSAAGLKRSTSCCRPDGGTLTITQTAGSMPGTHNWSFGPSCGAAMFDGKSATLPSCL